MSSRAKMKPPSPSTMITTVVRVEVKFGVSMRISHFMDGGYRRWCLKIPSRITVPLAPPDGLRVLNHSLIL